jgi:CMP-N,N'-diacetyllegionaminic acid synthase
MTSRPSAVGLVPARAGSQRVPGKNTRPLAGHPLLAYSIGAAIESGRFDRVIVSTDTEAIAEIATRYGAEVPFLRPATMATSTSSDVEWVDHVLRGLDERYDCFSILRPTSPFRTGATIERAFDRLLELPDVDSIRAVEPVRQHPGKMWVLDDDVMHPLLDQSHLEVPWYSSQMAALPPVYVQNSSLEIAWSRCIFEHGSIAGRVLAPFLTDEVEGLTIDYPDDWDRAEALARDGARLPTVTVAG